MRGGHEVGFHGTDSGGIVIGRGRRGPSSMFLNHIGLREKDTKIMRPFGLRDYGERPTMFRNGIQPPVQRGFDGGNDSLLPSFPYVPEENLGPFSRVLGVISDGKHDRADNLRRCGE